MPLFGENGIIQSPTTKALELAQASVTTTITQLEDDRQALTLALDEGADTGLTEELQGRIRQLRQNIADLGGILERQQRKLADAERAEDERLHAKELAAAKEAAKTRVRSFSQHTGEFSRQLNRVPDLLAQLHKALEEAAAAADRAELVSGTPGSLHTALILGHAIQAASLEEWLSDARAALQYDRTEVRALATEVDDAVSSATNEFEYALGLKDRPTREPTDAELFAQAEAERQQRETDEHARRVNDDPGYYAAQFLPAGKHTIIPGTEEQEAIRAAHEGRSPPMPHPLEMDSRPRRGGSGRSINPFTGS